MTIRVYEVGGIIRDRYLGFPSKDTDYSVEAESFDAMSRWIESITGKDNMFIIDPKYVTIRARIGKGTYDFVLCRKDGYYSDGRHPDSIQAGTLYDDLARRDFTMNAIAKEIALPGTEPVFDDIFIDPFGGFLDMDQRVIRCVGNTRDRITEDYLRLLRAVRFSITKQLNIHQEIKELFCDSEIAKGLKTTISKERIQEELRKMFTADTYSTMSFFGGYPLLTWACFADGAIWLKPTNQER